MITNIDAPVRDLAWVFAALTLTPQAAKPVVASPAPLPTPPPSLPWPALPLSMVELDWDHWSVIARIAGLRVGVNDDIRAEHRSRGPRKNLLNDIQGCAGEIVSLLSLAANPQAGGVRYLALSFDDPGNDDPDIITTLDGRAFRAETKCLLMKPDKHFFLVNRKAHQKSIDRKADYYLPVLTGLGCRRAMVGRPIPINDIKDWRVKDFDFGDPALAMPLDKFCPAYFDMSVAEVRATLNGHAPEEDPEEIDAQANEAVGRLDDLRLTERGPWRDMPIGDLMRKVTALFPSTQE